MKFLPHSSFLDNDQETGVLVATLVLKLKFFKDDGFWRRNEVGKGSRDLSSCHKDKDSAGERLEEMRLMCQLSWVRAGKKKLCCQKTWTFWSRSCEQDGPNGRRCSVA